MQNRDIQATQHIIRFLENAKAKDDEILDSIPGLFAIVDENGIIQRANKNLATILKTHHESLLGMSLSELFTEEDWAVFKERLRLYAEQGARGKSERTELDLALSPDVAEDASYLWQLAFFTEDDDGSLVTVIGSDVSEVKRATRDNARMQMELNAARTIQDTLFLPGSARLGPVEIAGHYEPASECGGDWWYYWMRDGKAYLFIGDVTGHGVPAALVTSGVRSAVSILETLPELGLSEMMKLLNQVVFDVAKGEKWMTFFLASIETETGILRYVRAAHEPTLLLPANADQSDLKGTKRFKRLVGTKNPLLGHFRDAEFAESEERLAPGDRLFFYTDGITELVSDDGNQWSLRGLQHAILRSINATGPDSVELTRLILKEANVIRNGRRLEDDVTFFTVRVDPSHQFKT